MQNHFFSRRSNGFSLVELSVVIVIISAILGMILSGLSSFSQSSTNTSTRAKQTTIQEALVAYLRVNGRLPCPDTGPVNITGITTANLPDGVENRLTDGPPVDTTTACRRPWGIVPYATLGLPREAALDAWGNYLTYVVSNSLAPAAPLTASPTRDWVITANFRSGSLGDLEVVDDAANFTEATVVLISHGPNGFGAFTTKGTQIAPAPGADEQVNAGGCAIRNAATGRFRCFKRAITESGAGGGAFDDLVLEISPDSLLGPLFAQGIRTPPAVEFLRRCNEIRDSIAVVGTTNRNGGPSPSFQYNISPGAQTNYTISDPYGGANPVCTVAANTQISATSPSGNLCGPLTSWGKNGALGGGDDLTCTITVDDLRGYFLKTGF